MRSCPWRRKTNTSQHDTGSIVVFIGNTQHHPLEKWRRPGVTETRRRPCVTVTDRSRVGLHLYFVWQPIRVDHITLRMVTAFLLFSMSKKVMSLIMSHNHTTQCFEAEQFDMLLQMRKYLTVTSIIQPPPNSGHHEMVPNCFVTVKFSTLILLIIRPPRYSGH